VIRAYHFVGATLRDGSPIPPDGEWLEFAGECVMCTSGLHWSRHPFDALTYAPGATLCLVDVDEIIAEQNDKGLSRRRRIVARFDATDMLWEMARWSALQVIHLWNAPQFVRDYLTTGDESLRAAARDAARDAARAAAWNAAWNAAWAAAQTAAWAAARAAAQDAAWNAAQDAAWNAAWAAAQTAARDAAQDAAWDAAQDAAWAAARDAARAAQQNHFLALVTAKFSALGIAA